jgi:stearoyl-CoA desaturase (delta-9 desaturase)
MPADRSSNERSAGLAVAPQHHEALHDQGERPGPEDVEPCENEALDRILTATVTIVPFLALGVVAWQVWSRLLFWSDLVAFAVMYVTTGLGITVGYHRHFTHRSFRTTRAVRAVLAALGSAALEGPVTAWVADHRKHHAFSDRPGDPHSPHVDHGGGLRGTLRGLFHAHLGWLFLHTDRGSKRRYARDLLDDPIVQAVDRTYLVWVAASLAVPFGLGWLIGGTLTTALTGLLWGGGVRLLFVHHVTFSINSLCHVFGRRPFRTRDESRNLGWLALASFGESWHNNHHAFPTSAVHGLGRWQLDPSAAVIRALERLGLAWDVVRVDERRRAAKLASG